MYKECEKCPFNYENQGCTGYWKHEVPDHCPDKGYMKDKAKANKQIGLQGQKGDKK